MRLSKRIIRARCCHHPDIKIVIDFIPGSRVDTSADARCRHLKHTLNRALRVVWCIDNAISHIIIQIFIIKIRKIIRWRGCILAFSTLTIDIIPAFRIFLLFQPGHSLCLLPCLLLHLLLVSFWIRQLQNQIINIGIGKISLLILALICIPILKKHQIHT